MKEKMGNKLGEMPVARLIVSMSVPMMISMFIQALYNVVDSMFVAMICEDALTAVSLAFPLQNIMGSIAVGTGVGLNAFVSRSLGEGSREKAHRAANVQLLLGAVYSLVFIVIGLCFARSFYESQTDVEAIINYGEEYLSVVCCFSLGCFYSQSFEKLLIATGNSTASMLAQAAGAVLNMILDPVFIFGLGPIPAMGVRGAAIATVLGQFASAAIAIAFNAKYNRDIKYSLSRILPTRAILRAIYSVGLPSMLTIGLASVMNYLMNGILLGFSTTAAAVFGVWMKLQSFGFMPVFGMNNGTIAIYSYNHGAGKTDRVFKTMRLALVMGTAITLCVTVFYELCPKTLLGLFSASENMLDIGLGAIRLCALSLPFGALSIILSSACQSLGRPRYTLGINVSRQLALQVPAAWLLSLTGRLGFVWLAPLFAEALTLLLAVYLSRRVIKSIK